MKKLTSFLQLILKANESQQQKFSWIFGKSFLSILIITHNSPLFNNTLNYTSKCLISVVLFQSRVIFMLIYELMFPRIIILGDKLIIIKNKKLNFLIQASENRKWTSTHQTRCSNSSRWCSSRNSMALRAPTSSSSYSSFRVQRPLPLSLQQPLKTLAATQTLASWVPAKTQTWEHPMNSHPHPQLHQLRLKRNRVELLVHPRFSKKRWRHKVWLSRGQESARGYLSRRRSRRTMRAR